MTQNPNDPIQPQGTSPAPATTPGAVPTGMPSEGTTAGVPSQAATADGVATDAATAATPATGGVEGPASASETSVYPTTTTEAATEAPAAPVAEAEPVTQAEPLAQPEPAAQAAPAASATPQPVPSTVDTPAPQDDKAKLLPFYLVCDVSQSMVESGALQEANNILPSLVQALEKDPIISDKVRFGVIDFSDDARVVLPLCDLLEQTTLPLLEGRGRTSYKAAFELLRTQIERDVNQLKADGFAVHRPAVFFLSDGAPTDPEPEWRAAFANLTQYDKTTGQGNRMYPNIIPFGLQGADPRTLQAVIHPTNPPERAMRLFMADQDQTPASAVTKMAKLLVTSVIQSSTGLAQGSNGIVLPKPEDGVKSYAADDDVFL